MTRGVLGLIVAGLGTAALTLVVMRGYSQTLVAASSQNVVSTGVQPRQAASANAFTPTDDPPKSTRRHSGIRFEDAATTLGMRYRYERGDSGDFWLPETMGGGVAWFDLDGDGRLDLYFSQGLRSAPGGADAVRWNRGARFVEPPTHVVPAAAAYGMGVVAGDFNNDGFDDLCATDATGFRLLINNGDGTLRAATDAGVASKRWATSAAFGDLDADGDLDLVVGCYAVYEHRRCTDAQTGQRRYCGPDVYRGDAAELYVNLGDGRFRDESASSGVGMQGAKALGVVVARLTDDDKPDVFVANDLVENFFFENRTPAYGAPKFAECAGDLGVARSGDGARQANMGVACGDYDNDGRLDLFSTHYYNEHDTLWRNLGPPGFRDVTKAARLYVPTLPQLSWGTQFLDADNDGWLDLFTTGGHINREANGTTPYKMPPQFFWNRADRSGRRHFEELGAEAGEFFSRRLLGRGSAAGDFDRDGRLDLAVVHHGADAALLQNRGASGSAIGLEFVGESSPRDGHGVRVVAHLDDRKSPLTREIYGGGSYLSGDARRIVLGGVGAGVRRLQVQWPSGRVDEYANLSPGAYYLLREGGKTPLAREAFRR